MTSAAIVLFLHYIYREFNLLTSCLIALGLGICKELFDWIIQSELFDLYDISYDVIGLSIAALITKLIKI